MGQVERFWGSVVKCEHGAECQSCCWPWQGRDRRVPVPSYGRCRYVLWGQSITYAHRVAWSLSRGMLPPAGLSVCHTCDNPPCCNPRHLWTGTQKQNHHDSVQKGRRRPLGSPGKPRKLTERSVQRIRKAYAQGDKTTREIATTFGVSQPLVSQIITRKLWSHVP